MHLKILALVLLVVGCSNDGIQSVSRVASSNPILGAAAAAVTVPADFTLPSVAVSDATGRGNVRLVTFQAGVQNDELRLQAAEDQFSGEPTCTLSIGPFDNETFFAILDSETYPEIAFTAGDVAKLDLVEIATSADVGPGGTITGAAANYFGAELNLGVLANGRPAKLRWISCSGSSVVWKSIESALGGLLAVVLNP